MSTPTNGTLASIPACITTIAHDGTVLCSWSNNPSFRGTLNILTLCLSTLGLCVWNAVHPDVPYPGTPKWRVIRKRVWWLFVGLFMPEMLVLTALGQFRQAYTLLVRVSRETRVPTEFPWWMTVIERLWPTPLTGNEIVPIQRTPSLRESEHASPNMELDDMSTLLPTRAFETSLPVTAPAPGKPAGEEGARRERKHPWTLTHSFYAVMHGFLNPDGDAFWTTREDQDGDLETVFDADKGILHTFTSHDPEPGQVVSYLYPTTMYRGRFYTLWPEDAALVPPVHRPSGPSIKIIPENLRFITGDPFAEMWSAQ